MFFRTSRPTFEEVARDVLRLRRLKADRTRRNAEWQISRLITAFGKLKVARVTEDHWADYLLRESAKKPRKFFDDRKHMNLILRHAHRKGLVKHVISLIIPDTPWDAGRELTSDELRRIRRMASRETPDSQGRYTFKSEDLLFQIDIAWKMGLRLNEMLRLRWDQFNWETETIRLRAADVKTRKGREVPINPDLVADFRRRHSRAACQWVFPNSKLSGPLGSNKTAWRRCKREAGVRCRWHDLRHTCATRMLRAGVPRHVVKAYLGMSERVLDRIYTHLNLQDMRSAALLMTDQVAKVGIQALQGAAIALTTQKKTGGVPARR